MKINLDDEEVMALIDFHESMARDARDSCEFDEAKLHEARVAALRTLAVFEAAR
jgi:hypothetical protein